MDRWAAAFRLVGVGFFIGACILLGTFAGLWLDGKLGTKPIFTLLGLFLGLALAVFGVYQMLLPLLRNQKNEERN